MDVEPGDYISFTGKINAADTLFGESYDNYHAKGIFFRISAKSAVSVENTGFDLRSVSARLSRFLSERVEKIFPADTAVFMKSLSSAISQTSIMTMRSTAQCRAPGLCTSSRFPGCTFRFL